MLSERGGYALNYNGELYNAVELQRLRLRRKLLIRIPLQLL